MLDTSIPVLHIGGHYPSTVIDLDRKAYDVRVVREVLCQFTKLLMNLAGL